MVPKVAEPTFDPARRERIALAVVLAFVLIWGANFQIQKWIYQSLSPGAVLFLRYGVFMPVFSTVLMLIVYGRKWPRLTRPQLWLLFKLGFIGHALHVSLVTWAVHWSTAFSSSLILAGGPVFTLLILRFLEKERLARATTVGVGIALVGILIFMSDKLLNAGWQASGGDLALLVAACLFSLYTVKIRPHIEEHGSVATMCYVTLLNCPLIALTFAPFGLQVSWPQVPPLLWCALLYSIGISAFLGWIAWGWANSVRGAARNAPTQYLMPPVAGLIAWLGGGEQFSTIKIAGAVVALAGVALAQFGSPKPPASEPPSD